MNGFTIKRPERLVEYFVTVGIKDHLVPLPQEQVPIVDIRVVKGNEEPPEDFFKVEFSLCGNSADLNSGYFATSLFLCVRRSELEAPITDITVIYPQKKERCPPGYQMLAEDLNKGSYGSSVHLCYSRHGGARGDVVYAPIVDLGLLSEKEEASFKPAGYTRINKNVNAGSFRNGIHLWFKRAPVSPLEISYKPEILDRFPPVDLKGSPLPNSIGVFCHPEGASLHVDTPPLPSSSSFVLTLATGLELYGSCLTFYEPLDWQNMLARYKHSLSDPPAEKGRGGRDTAATRVRSTAVVLSQLAKILKTGQVVYAPKSICLVSYWPFFDCFATFLSELYRMSVGVTAVPLERYLTNLWECPLALNSRVNVCLRIAHKRIVFDRPPPDTFPLANFPVDTIFQCLRVDCIVDVISAMLLERKIILASKHRSLLTPVAEALRCFVFPFQWQYAYVPVLPRFISGIVEAPMPVLVGIHTDQVSFRILQNVEQAVVVNLDLSKITTIGYKAVPLPSKLTKRLATELEEEAHIDIVPHLQSVDTSAVMAVGSAFKFGPVPAAVNGNSSQSSLGGSNSSINLADFLGDEDDAKFNVRACRAAFLQVFVTLLGNYKDYLRFPAWKNQEYNLSFEDLFDRDGYVGTRPSQYKPFLSAFTSTQTFANFVDERTYSAPARRQQELEFFDKCCHYSQHREETLAKLRRKSSISVLSSPTLVQHLSEQHYRDLYYVVPKPDRTGLDKESYRYSTFPKLNLVLFRRPRPVDVKYMLNVANEKRHNLKTCFMKAFESKHTSQRKLSDTAPSAHVTASPAEWSKTLLRHVYACWFQLQMTSLSTHVSVEKAILDVFLTLDALVTRGVIPDEGIYRAVLIICGKHRKRQEARIIFDTMKKFGVKPSSATYGAYASALAEGLNLMSSPESRGRQVQLASVNSRSASVSSALSLSHVRSRSASSGSRSARRAVPSPKQPAAKLSGRGGRRRQLSAVVLSGSGSSLPLPPGTEVTSTDSSNAPASSTASAAPQEPALEVVVEANADTASESASSHHTEPDNADDTQQLDTSALPTGTARGDSTEHLFEFSYSNAPIDDPFRLAEDAKNMVDKEKIAIEDRLEHIDWSSLRMGCLNICPKCEYPLQERDILAGWTDDGDARAMKCVGCHNCVFVPYMMVQYRFKRAAGLLNDRHRKSFEHVIDAVQHRAATAMISQHHSTSTADDDEKKQTALPPSSASDPALGSQPDEHKDDTFSALKRSSSDSSTRRQGPLSPTSSVEYDYDDDSTPWEEKTVRCSLLSPVALRQDLEAATVAFRTDFHDLCLFRALHPIMYWNLLWLFSNINLPLDFIVGAEELGRLCLSEIPLLDLVRLSCRTVHEQRKSQHLQSESPTFTVLPPSASDPLADESKYNDLLRGVVLADPEQLDTLRDMVQANRLHSAMTLFISQRNRLLNIIKGTPGAAGDKLQPAAAQAGRKKSVQLIHAASSVPVDKCGVLYARTPWMRSVFAEFDALVGDAASSTEFGRSFDKAYALLPQAVQQYFTRLDGVPSKLILAIADTCDVGKKCKRFEHYSSGGATDQPVRPTSSAPSPSPTLEQQADPSSRTSLESLSNLAALPSAGSGAAPSSMSAMDVPVEYAAEHSDDTSSNEDDF